MKCRRCPTEITDQTADRNQITGNLKSMCRECTEKNKEKAKHWYYSQGGYEYRKKKNRAARKLQGKISDEELDKISENYVKNNTIEQKVNYYPNTWNAVC